MTTAPSEFLWGAAASAHAVEGSNFNNDWWRWEQRPGRIAESAISKFAADHYQRYRDDFRLARKLGHRAHLFTLEWSRIEPEPGRFDDAALDHYSGVFETLRAEGIEPVCALHHAASPAWFAEQGGWCNAAAPREFERYAQRVAEAYAQKCRWWIPILEPVHTVEMAYIEGLWPPGRGRLLNARDAFANTVQAHAHAYRALHTQRGDALVGASARARHVKPLNENSAWDYRAARREAQRSNHWLYNAVTSGRWPKLLGKTPPQIAGTADFLAVSYYGAETVRFNAFRPGRQFAQPVDDAGRPVKVPRPYPCPDALPELMTELARHNLPMLIAGNGVPTEDDTARCRFMLDHVAAVLDCRKAGADIRGYFHYSLLDGFEWTEGYGARYGLIHVDTATQARTPNPSAYLYKTICETGAIRHGAVDQFSPGWQQRKAIP